VSRIVKLIAADICIITDGSDFIMHDVRCTVVVNIAISCAFISANWCWQIVNFLLSVKLVATDRVIMHTNNCVIFGHVIVILFA